MSEMINNANLKELVGSKKSYLKCDIINSSNIDNIGENKYQLDKKEILKHVKTKLKGEFIYTDGGVIYIDNAKKAMSDNNIGKPISSIDKDFKALRDAIQSINRPNNNILLNLEEEESYSINELMSEDRWKLLMRIFT